MKVYHFPRQGKVTRKSPKDGRCLLRPENPFPAALDDFLAVYRGLLAQGVQAGQIAVMGESSGCGLALAGLTCIRDAGEPLPAVMIAMCPMVDQTNSGDTFRTRARFDPYHLDPKCRPS